MAAALDQGAARFTTLLRNDELAQVERLRILGHRRFTQRSRGEHRARGGGRSLEFKDYRDYVEGDDIRFLDWNLLARLRRPYVRMFHDEEEQHVAVLIDGSASMGFEGKLTRACQLGAAFGVMGLMAGERVTAHCSHGRGTGARSIRAPRGRAGLRPWLQFCESIAAGGDAPLEDGIAALLRTHRGRGVLVVLSDFLTAGDLRTPFHRVLAAGLEVFALQILGPTELAPPLQSDVRLVDSETGEHLDITAAGDLLALYHEHRRAFARRIEDLCRGHGGRYALVGADEDLRAVLFQRLRRAGWVS